jgi:hypothetical protein
LCYELIITDANDFLNMDVAGVKSIVTGIRAYNTDKQLPLALGKMLEFMRSGGRLVVQYNTNSNLHPGSVMAPYPFTITRNRTTEEDAPVQLTDTTHVLFNIPNRIRQHDFSGWIQERGLYFASEIAPEFSDLIRMSDKGEEPVGGSLICAPYGRGQFIYTGLSFFRQVPAGNPGAIRLLCNLIGN